MRNTTHRRDAGATGLDSTLLGVDMIEDTAESNRRRSPGIPVHRERITRRNLPHWQMQGSTYFLTWRCRGAVVLAESERDIVMSAIRHWDRIRWYLYAAVVMPDHVHILARPLQHDDGVWDLADLLHSVKSYSAHQISDARTKQRDAKSTGDTIWQDERYDRWIRDDDEFAEKWQYIADNPVKAGLSLSSTDYRWLYLLDESPVF